MSTTSTSEWTRGTRWRVDCNLDGEVKLRSELQKSLQDLADPS